MFLIVIPLDRDDRNSGLLEHAEPGERVIHRFGRDVALVKKVSAYKDKIHIAIDGIFFQNIDPGIEKISRTFGQLIPCASQMHIGNMQKLHLFILSHGTTPMTSPRRLW
jgi:hypothetical protein